MHRWSHQTRSLIRLQTGRRGQVCSTDLSNQPEPESNTSPEDSQELPMARTERGLNHPHCGAIGIGTTLRA